MFVSGEKIKELVAAGELGITPFNPANVKSASYMFTLDNRVRVTKSEGDFLDARVDAEFSEQIIPEDGLILEPGAFAVFFTKESVNLSGKYICLLSTRSSSAQIGLDISQGSFLCEPESNQQFALEISNHNNVPIKLFPGMKITKGIFSKVA